MVTVQTGCKKCNRVSSFPLSDKGIIGNENYPQICRGCIDKYYSTSVIREEKLKSILHMSIFEKISNWMTKKSDVQGKLIGFTCPNCKNDRWYEVTEGGGSITDPVNGQISGTVRCSECGTKYNCGLNGLEEPSDAKAGKFIVSQLEKSIREERLKKILE